MKKKGGGLHRERSSAPFLMEESQRDIDFGPSLKIKNKPQVASLYLGEGRVDYLIRLCMVVGWCIDHPEYTAKIKVIPKKDYPSLMPCEF